MKKAWCPQTAEKSLIDTVKSCGPDGESNAAEMISAMAGGWKSKLVLEAWSKNCATKDSSIALAIAARHTGGRHVCIVPDDVSRVEYTDFMKKHDIPVPEIIVGPCRREFLDSLVCIDFLFIQGDQQDELLSLFGRLKLCHHGAVVAWKGIKKILGFFDNNSGLMSVVGSFALPNGLHIAYVAPSTKGKGSPKGHVPWIRQIDRKTGEEHIFRG